MSLRQSSIPARTSSAPSHSSQGPSSATVKLLEKKKEYDAVSALEKASTLYLQRIETLGNDCDIMAKAGEGMNHLTIPPIIPSDNLTVHGQVLEQWPRMFQILSLFRELTSNNIVAAWLTVLLSGLQGETRG